MKKELLSQTIEALNRELSIISDLRALMAASLKEISAMVNSKKETLPAPAEQIEIVDATATSTTKNALESMSREEIERKVEGVLIDILNVDWDEFYSSNRLVEDLGADSLDLMEILVAIEEEFGMFVTEEDVEHVKTVGDIVDYIWNAQNPQDKSEEPSEAVIKEHSERGAIEDIRCSLSEDIIQYISDTGGAALSDIGNFLDGADFWSVERTRNFIEQHIPELKIRDEYVYKNEARHTCKNENREITKELLTKYLQNKGGRATLKQIQSRFKGYAENTCKELDSKCLKFGFALEDSLERFSETTVHLRKC